MAHDKENIDKLKKSNAFDSEVDPLVLGIDNEEREALAKSFEKMNKTASKGEKTIDPLAGFGDSFKKNKTKKVSFFQKIINFFKHLLDNLGFSEGANISSKEIKKIKQNLSEFGQALVNFKTKKLESAFARYIYDIYKTLDKVHTLLEETEIENSEISLGHPIFFVRFISNLLSDETKEKLKIFTNDYINKLIENESSPMVVLKSQLQDFENAININEKANLNTYIEPLDRMLTAYSYNFKKFLRKFLPENPDLFKKKNKLAPDIDEQPKEPEISPEKLGDLSVNKSLVELKKLNDYLRVLDISKLPKNFAENFDNTVKSLQTEKTEQDEENEQENEEIEQAKIQLDAKNTETKDTKQESSENKYDNINISSDEINAMLKKTDMLNSKDILDGIIRYFTEDSTYKGRMVKVKVYIIDKYVELLKEKAIGNFNRLEVYKREQKIANTITSFFGIKSLDNLSAVNNYNETMNKELKKRNIDRFKNTKKAILMKNFIEKIYKQDIESTIKNLLVEGDFIDKDGQQDFSESFYKIEQRQKDFDDFEAELSDESDEMQKIRNFLYSAMHDISVKNVARRKIHEIDNSCDIIFKDFVIQLNNISKYLEKCLNDSKSSGPVFIYNMKTISGSNNRIFVNNVFKCQEQIKAFLNISKNFTLIHNKI